MILIAAIITLIVAAGGTYFALIQGETASNILSDNIQKEVTSQSESVQRLDLRIDKFIFADNINNDLTYEVNDNNTYFEGNNIFIYIEPTGYYITQENDTYNLDVVEDIEVIDPDGKLIPDLSKKGLIKTNKSASSLIAFKNEFNLGHDPKEGMYTVRITINDNLARKKVVKEGTFKMNLLHFDNMRFEQIE